MIFAPLLVLKFPLHAFSHLNNTYVMSYLRQKKGFVMVIPNLVVPNLIEFIGDDLDFVICLICGLAPKILVSDGNSKVFLRNFLQNL